MKLLRVEFFGGPRDGAEIPATELVRWAVGREFSHLEGHYRFEELPDGRRVARFLGDTQRKRSS